MQNTKLMSEALAALAAVRLAEIGYPADYGLDSLERLDEVIDSFDAGPCGPTANEFLHLPDVPAEAGAWLRVVQLGCYLGEALRRRLGGKWLDHRSDDPGPKVWALVGFPNGKFLDPVWSVAETMNTGWPLSSLVRVVVDRAEGRGDLHPTGFDGPAPPAHRPPGPECKPE